MISYEMNTTSRAMKIWKEKDTYGLYSVLYYEPLGRSSGAIQVACKEQLC